MRVTPTLSQGGTVNWSDNAIFTIPASVVLDRATPYSGQLYCTWSSAQGANFRPGGLRSETGTGWLALDAEVYA